MALSENAVSPTDDQKLLDYHPFILIPSQLFIRLFEDGVVALPPNFKVDDQMSKSSDEYQGHMNVWFRRNVGKIWRWAPNQKGS